MPLDYQILPEEKLAYIEAWDYCKGADFIDTTLEVVTSDRWKPNFSVLVDLTDVTSLDVGIEELEEAVKRNELYRDVGTYGPDTQIAMVVRDQQDATLATLYNELLENGVEIDVFYRLDKAIDWLSVENEQKIRSLVS